MANYQRDPSGKLAQHFNERKQLVSVSLTPTAIAGLDALARHYGLNGRSAFLEQLGRGLVPLSTELIAAVLPFCMDQEAL